MNPQGNFMIPISICSHFRIKLPGTVIGLILFIIVSSANTLACPIELPTTTITIKGHSLTVELAITPTQRSCGLSHRDELPDNHGMLFVFPDLRPRDFWMKDTTIPLSIAYLDESGRIFSLQEMVPNQTGHQYPSARPAKYALEVNQGWFQQKGIEVGDKVEIKLPVILDIR
jgi:uncharacterized membrane protein (UPF0127 family)